MSAYARATIALQLVLLPVIAGANIVVEGNNDPTVDVIAVQAAVNAVNEGGRVLLVGTFDFGDAGRVLLTRDVEISGESDQTGVPLTTIRRGEWPFYSPLPASIPPTGPGPKVAVQSIHFDGPKGVAVHLAYTGGATIQQNRVTRMRGRLFDATNFRRAGVLIGPLDSRPRNVIAITPQLVSGQIHVLDNYFDSSGSEDSTKTNAGAVFMILHSLLQLSIWRP